MSRFIGVTTWIKRHVLKGVPFTRKNMSGQRGKHTGQQLGRQVDSLFKEYCKTGKIKSFPKDAAVRANYVVSALAAVGLTPYKANVFVKLGGLKTHIDGMAMDRAGKKVVIELKATQATAANHVLAYDTPCSALPMTTIGTNTERLHHQLQTVFGVRAVGADRGVTVVACADKAIVYTVNDGFSDHVFANTKLHGQVETRYGAIPRWVPAGKRGLPAEYTVKRVMQKQVALLEPQGAAIVLPAPPSVAPKSVVSAAKALLVEYPGPRFFVWPRHKAWHALCI